MIVFEEAKQLFSEARMQKYLRACGGDKDQAMQLYSYNARLSQAFFGVVSLFEVILRNAINEHYLKTLGENWIINQTISGDCWSTKPMKWHLLRMHTIRKTYIAMIRWWAHLLLVFGHTYLPSATIR